MDSGIAMNMLLAGLCSVLGKRYILGIHDPGFFREEPLQASTLKSASMSSYNAIKRFMIGSIKTVHTINSYQTKSLRALGYKGEIFNIPIFLYYKVKGADIWVNRKEFSVFMIGRLDYHQKGIDFFETVVKRVTALRKKVRFIVIGKGAEKGESVIKGLIEKHGKSVSWLGFGTEREKTRCYKEASLFIMPSRFEGLPATLLEAQVFGLPVVAFNIPGPSDIIRSKIQGSLVPTFNTERFARTIMQYYKLWESDKAKYLEMKRKISKLAYDRYNAEMIIDKMEEMFNGRVR
jgi:glycosyltransferase involved in cell wall biosynthesis